MPNLLIEQEKSVLADGLEKLNISLTEDAQQKLLTYLHFLDKWNEYYNLTAVRSLLKMIPYHVLDSLSIAAYLHGDTILDVGTGAGLPGIPLAIYAPTKHFTLLDSNGKKTRFLIQAIAQLGLKNVTVLQERAENYLNDSGFDCIITRALGSLTEMTQATKHLCKKEGYFLFMKGLYPEDELRLLTETEKDIATVDVARLNVPGIDAQRHLVVLRKTGDS